MNNFKAGWIIALSSLLFSAHSPAATFVYVSNNEDGNIGVYTLQSDGSLLPGARVATAGKVVMPMTVSPDKRFLIAGVRSTPFTAQTYSIGRSSGALKSIATGPLHESYPYIYLDRSGRFLLGASSDNRFVYLLNELTATVTTLALDGKTGLLTEVSSASALPPDSKLVPGGPRGPDAPKRNRDNDIWASDLHLTPNRNFLYAAERTSSSLGAFSVDAASGKLTYLGSTPTEKQPRGFSIDPTGRYVVVSGEESNTLSTYSIDPASGALKPIGKYPTGKGSNWVEIVSFD